MHESVCVLRKAHLGVIYFLPLPALFCILPASVYLSLEFLVYIMPLNVLPVHMYAYCKQVWYSQRLKECTLKPLELGSQIVVSHHGGAGKWTQELCKNSKCSDHWTISPNPVYSFISQLYLRAEKGREEWQSLLLFQKRDFCPPSPSFLECSLASQERMTNMSHTHEFVGDITKYSENMSDSENG